MRIGFVGVAASVVALGALFAAAPERAAPDGPVEWYLQSNLAGGRADGAELRGMDDVVVALAARIDDLPAAPRAVFLNEACESHGAHVAARLGPEWRALFVQAWPGPSHCFPAPGEELGRYGNALLVHDADATSLVVPSCNDPGSAPDQCLPNWAPPAEQRRAVCAESDGDLLCSVHLDPHHWQWHDEQLRAIGRIATNLAPDYDSVVVGGDLNAGRRETRRAFDGDGLVHFVDLAGSRPLRTYPAASPRRELDHLLYGTRRPASSGGSRTIDLGRCAATHLPDGACSDHLALLAGVVVG